MALADALINKVNKVLAKFDATDRQVYKRVFTRTGGDALLGRPGSVSSVDTLLNPQPLVTKQRPVTSIRDSPTASSYDPAVLGAAGVALATDYVIYTSSTAITMADLENKDLVIVLKDGTGDEEELSIVSYAVDSLNGKAVVYSLLGRSKKR